MGDEILLLLIYHRVFIFLSMRAIHQALDMASFLVTRRCDFANRRATGTTLLCGTVSVVRLQRTVSEVLLKLMSS
jgi:hypothetical protein